MAELPHLGRHCSHAECHRLDFLSISCSGCAQAFCKDHFAFDNHNCARKLLAENAVAKDSAISDDGPKSYKCSLSDCGNAELVPVMCVFCEDSFCLQHRHQTDHNCRQLVTPPDRMQKTQQHVQSILAVTQTSQQSTKAKGRKSKAMAAKVALMKIKQKAVGDKTTPDGDRVYFSITLPDKYKNVVKPVFVSKHWSVGKSVDDIAMRLKLENNNNSATSEKLLLCDADSDTSFCFEQMIHDLLTNESVFNGSALRLIYVTPQDFQSQSNRI